MKTCETCKHWQRMDEEDYSLGSLLRDAIDGLDYWTPDNWTPAERAEVEAIQQRIGRCGSPSLLFYVMPQSGQAAVLDGSEYKGELVTDRHFGCTNHQAKEAA